MADPEIVAPIAIGAASAAIIVQDFVKRIAGPAADELGSWARDALHELRQRRLARVAGRATELLTAAKLTPHAVPLKTLVPLLEGAAWEDDESLQELWSALLANAAGGEGVSLVYPAFPILLRQLSGLDARILEFIWERASDTEATFEPSVKRPETLFPRFGVSIARMQVHLGADPVAVEISIDNLVGLGLVYDEPIIRPDWMGVPAVTTRSEVRLSSFGTRFVGACRPPAARSGEGR